MMDEKGFVIYFMVPNNNVKLRKVTERVSLTKKSKMK